MSLIPIVGRKSLKSRLLIGGLYIVLSLGAVTMVYPFLLMLGTSITSGVDINEFRVVPRYLYDDLALFRKYAEDKYFGNLDLLGNYYRAEFAKLDELPAPKIVPDKDPRVRRFAEDWLEFERTIPSTDKLVGFTGYSGSPSLLRERYQAWLRQRFQGDINKLNRLYQEEHLDFNTVYQPFERLSKPEWSPDDSPKMREWQAWKAKLPQRFLLVVGADPLYGAFLKENCYDNKIDLYNRDYKAHCSNFREIGLPPTAPSNPLHRQHWEQCVRTKIPLRYLRVAPRAVSVYRIFLKKRYPNIQALNKAYHTNYASFEQIQLPKRLPPEGPKRLDYKAFIESAVPIADVRVDSPENRYREWLLRKYGSLQKINAAYGTRYASVMEILPPYMEADWLEMKSRQGEIRRDFMLRNYRTVIAYIALHGRALVNTAILCIAAVLTHLIVNPLCAYALSRFNLTYSYRVLLFLLATMAFPAEVAAIPNFLLLKKLHLLNTFWALILPGMASGYSIFLLKGFFDSLPKELYEAGTLDGASESRMFWQITLPLSKPIFAVIALSSFTHAYTGWIWAFIVCQDQKMWTLMVWLYQLQASAPTYVMLAALAVTSIPTLLIFAFCQNIIMRGIILPTSH